MKQSFFNFAAVNDLEKLIKDKTIQRVFIADSGMDMALVFTFTDGNQLSIRYDWIYDYEFRQRTN